MLAEWGIDERDSVEVLAVALGITFPEDEAAARHRRQYEAIAALLWLLKVLALEGRTRDSIVEALEPSLGDFPVVRDILHEKKLDLDWAERDCLAEAVAAARLAFLNAMGLDKETRVSLPVTFDPTELRYENWESK
jgi:hypothetical protein